MTSTSSPTTQPPPPPIEDLDWEEWDSTGGLSFTHHCLAGSFAGVAEHTLLYPLDTVKTCWQSQVLHRAAGGGGVGCDPCSVHQTVNKFTPSSSTLVVNSSSPAAAAVHSSSIVKSTGQQQHQQQSIWSTMKHLMRHGHHQGGGGGGGHGLTHQQFSHAHVFTLANNSTAAAALENTHLAPNVVDLTTNKNNNVESKSTLNISTNNNQSQQQQRTSSSGSGSSKRPWSKSARVIRGATLQDIAPALQPSLYHSSSSAAAGGGSGGASSVIANPLLGNNTTTLHNAVNNAFNNGAIMNNSSNNNNTGFKRLWRGVQTMFVGCIPAHALYFSSYEIVKSICLDHNITAIHQQHKTASTNNNHGGGHNTNNSGGNKETSQQHHVGIDTLSPIQAMVAGGIATLLHDFIMTPMDTMKQRMQLGHYYNLRDAFCSIVWGDRTVVVAGAATTTSGGSSGGSTNANNAIKEGVQRMGGEGWKGLYRSFPITVMTNVPYGMIMMTTNEWLRAALEDGIYGFQEHHPYGHHHEEKPFHFFTILLSGMGAGTVASAVTAPLDRIKTRLQTQRMGMMIPSAVMEGGGVGGGGGVVGTGGAVIMEERALAAAMGERKVCPKMAVQDVKSALFPSSSSSSSASSFVGAPSSSMNSTTSIPRPPLVQSPFTKTYYTTPIEAFQSILQEEGPRGLFRGALPRVALHAPSVAISWTAYETAKGWLMWLQ